MSISRQRIAGYIIFAVAGVVLVWGGFQLVFWIMGALAQH